MTRSQPLSAVGVLPFGATDALASDRRLRGMTKG